MSPALVILAALPAVSWVNHTLPSGDAAMPDGPVSATGTSVTEPSDGSRRPIAWGANRAVNQTCPSEATATLRGAAVVEPSVVGVLVTAPLPRLRARRASRPTMRPRRMRVLVIGAAGMLGGKLVERLARDGCLGSERISQLTLVDRAVAEPPGDPGFAVESTVAD